MPIYEYHCKSCNMVFELRRGFDEADKPASCPHCGDPTASRMISLSAVLVNDGGSVRSAAGSGGCSGCGSSGTSACSTCRPR